jgi:site-specific DNA recombinase
MIQNQGSFNIASTPTYGYKLDPDDKHKWVIDEPAAEVVRLVFKHYNDGMQVSEIARTLEKAKYPAPSHYRNRVVKGSRTEKNPYHWTGSSVTAILKRQEYVGDTVNFKTYHTSFKDKQVRYRDEESFTIIRDTQEAIISREEYEKAKKRRKSTKRVIQTREKHLLDDMVFCNECGKKMYLNFRKYASGNCYVYICDSYRKKKGCTSHYIQEAEVIDSVLHAVRRIFDMYRLDKNECRRTLVRWICQRNETKSHEANERVKAITERLDTINKTEQALFEQKLLHEISQETFTNITVSMNAESESLRNEYGNLLILLDSFDDQKKSVPRFLTKAGTFADTEITKDSRYILEQLIEKVTIQEVEITNVHGKPTTEIRVLVHFVDIGLI